LYEAISDLSRLQTISDRRRRFLNRSPPLPGAIKQLHIENYQSIIKTGLSAIPLDSQWLFSTGENSFGKTTVLQAIVIGLFGKFDDHKILTKEDCAIGIELKIRGTIKSAQTTQKLHEKC